MREPSTGIDIWVTLNIYFGDRCLGAASVYLIGLFNNGHFYRVLLRVLGFCLVLFMANNPLA